MTFARGRPRDAGRDVGGVTRGVVFVLLDADEEEETQEGVPDAEDAVVEERLGKAGVERGLLWEAEEEDGAFQVVPREAEEREDCAVEDLSFRTREVLFAVLGAAVEEEEEGVAAVIWAQPAGSEEPLMPLGPGREG